ncbi:MAG: DUF4178 domain-containing protein [Burkholderiales bacterium]|nr:DUF4178 domain-containing protein [Burkholderiales bacterium]
MFFRGATSIVAVCEFCKSTLVRKGPQLEDIGKMAELLEDATPIKLGTEGVYRGKAFSVIGRIQYRYGSGVWNEWYCFYDDGREGWLSDAMGNYLVTFLRPLADPPKLEQIAPGWVLQAEGKRFQVVDIERAQVVAGAGELPVQVGAGWDAPVVDLRSEQGDFATIDYSEDPPLFYVGEQVPFEALRFTGLRDDQAATGPATAKAVAFACPACGAPLEKRVQTTEAIGCKSCGAVIDVTNPQAAILSRLAENAARYTPAIPLGTRGRFDGAEFETVGYMRREIVAEGTAYSWGEYLLNNPAQGYRWITEYEGHFSVVRDCEGVPGLTPGKRPVAHYRGTVFRHFQRSEPRVTYVAGEFYWRVRLGDTATVDDYVAPPLVLSGERTGNEITWSVGEYVEPQALWQQLGLKTRPPKRTGIAPNQPSPYTGKVLGYWKAFAILALVALVLQAFFRLGADTRVLQSQQFDFVPGRGASTIVTPPFELRGAKPVPLAVRSMADVDNSWVYLNVTLIEQNTGATYQLGREVSYYHGSSDGESWTEGDKSDRARIASVPPGLYYLEIEPEGDVRGRRVSGRVDVFRDPPDWANFIVALAILALFPARALWRSVAFERQRWAESDYAPASSGDDD